MPPSMDPVRSPSPPTDANSRHDRQPQTEKPFRFLDLPKELRLEMYECLTIRTVHKEIKRTLLPDEETDASIANKYRETVRAMTAVMEYLPGVLILATCRFIQFEASAILKPKLERILCQAPKMLLDLDQVAWFCKISPDDQKRGGPLECLVVHWIRSQDHPERDFSAAEEVDNETILPSMGPELDDANNSLFRIFAQRAIAKFRRHRPFPGCQRTNPPVLEIGLCDSPMSLIGLHDATLQVYESLHDRESIGGSMWRHTIINLRVVRKRYVNFATESRQWVYGAELNQRMPDLFMEMHNSYIGGLVREDDVGDEEWEEVWAEGERLSVVSSMPFHCPPTSNV